MGFPIKKRLASCAASSDMPNMPSSSQQAPNRPSGLDLLSAAMAVDSSRSAGRRESIPPRTVSEGSISTVVSAASYSVASDESDAAPSSAAKAMATSSHATTNRAKTFPEILLGILSTPEYAGIVSWLPHGNSFAIHDSAQFQAKILPKYFRKVIFRSFVRKLNRWGFRSVKRSVSGCEGAVFEHVYFRRDQPELCARMHCKSNPATGAKAQAKKGSTVSPSSSADGLTAIASALPSAVAAPQAPYHASPSAYAGSSGLGGRDFGGNEEFPVQLASGVLLREVQRRRQEALLQLVGTMHDSEADVLSRYLEMRLAGQR